MKTKYATLIRSLLKNYHEQMNTIEKESFSVHSDGIQLMELNLQLAKCLEGITLIARFNNDFEDYCEVHDITIKADTESRELVSRETTIQATDRTSVIGTATLMAGSIQQVSTGNFSQAVQGSRLDSIGGSDETEIAGSGIFTIGQNLTEQIGQIRKSVAAIKQEIVAPVVWIGSGSINVVQLMLDTLDVVKQLAEQTASHAHSDTGTPTPTNADAIRGTGTQADSLNEKYSPVISK